MGTQYHRMQERSWADRESASTRVARNTDQLMLSHARPCHRDVVPVIQGAAQSEVLRGPGAASRSDVLGRGEASGPHRVGYA